MQPTDDLAPRRMHLQAPGVRFACGETRPCEVFPDGGALFGSMTTHLPWVDCPECLEISRNETPPACCSVCGRKVNRTGPEADLCRLCYQRLCFGGKA